MKTQTTKPFAFPVPTAATPPCDDADQTRATRRAVDALISETERFNVERAEEARRARGVRFEYD